jgi:hypothetical protein
MQPMQWQEHYNFSNPCISNPTTIANFMDIYERKNKQGEPQRTPRSRSNEFPHKEKRLIGRIVDLDLLSLFLQVDKINMREIKRKKAPKGP